MVVESSTNHGGDDITSRASGTCTAPAGSAASASRWTESRERPRTIADAACGWPPPPSPARAAPMSSAGVRLRPTTNTRPSISTAITSASHSASSTILLATVEMPST